MRPVTKVKSTLSDRAVVNHCVRVQLEQRLNSELLELNCNVHPLDGLASEARKTLKKVDSKYEIKSTLYENDCCAANVTYGLSKMRYKNGKGDPKGFKQYMRKHQIQLKLTTRHVGNWRHMLFRLAGSSTS